MRLEPIREFRHVIARLLDLLRDTPSYILGTEQLRSLSDRHPISSDFLPPVVPASSVTWD